jgi:hypothetical protein
MITEASLPGYLFHRQISRRRRSPFQQEHDVDAILGPAEPRSGRDWPAATALCLLAATAPAGDDDRPDISNTFLQPFAAHTWSSAWTASVQTETSDNWQTAQWSVPVNAALSRLVMFGKLPVSLQGGVGYWLESPDGGPEGFRFRLQANFVLPR